MDRCRTIVSGSLAGYSKWTDDVNKYFSGHVLIVKDLTEF